MEKNYYFTQEAEYGNASMKELEELSKALSAQEGVTDYVTLQGGGALMPQSLESTYAMLTFNDTHLKFQKDIGISKAYSTVEEYTLKDGIGTEEPWVGQLQNPEEATPDFRKAYAKMKFMRSMWQVGDVMGEVRTITDPYAEAIEAAQMRNMRALEHALFFGNEDVVSEEIDGLEKIIQTYATSQHIFDLRGAPLSQDVLRQAAELIADNYGRGTKMYVSNSTMTTLGDILGNTSVQRIIQNNQGKIDLGNPVGKFHSNFGSFDIEPDIFLRWESETVPMIKDTANPGQIIEGATSAKAPGTPSIAVTATSNSNTKFSALSTGLKFRVAALNGRGRSAACAASSAVALTSGQQYAVEITQAGSGEPTTGYLVYRETGEGTGVYRLVARIKKTGSPMTFNDYNQVIAGTAKAFLCDLTSSGNMRAVSLAQLTPPHKLEYARIAPYRWGTVGWYLGMKWYAPLRFVQFINIGVGRAQSSAILDL